MVEGMSSAEKGKKVFGNGDVYTGTSENGYDKVEESNIIIFGELIVKTILE